jgi:hypothetical protein
MISYMSIFYEKCVCKNLSNVCNVVDIGEEVQYEIDEMTITADEKYVVYSNIYSNDIVFLDFRAKKKAKIIKGMSVCAILSN